MTRIQRGLVYLRNGTLLNRTLQRVRWKWRQHIKRRRLAWWESQIGKRQCIEAEIQPGIRMQLYLDSRLSLAIYRGDFELKEQQFLNAFLRPGDTFVDIGANIGLFTLIAAQSVGNTGHVYAFEPCAKTYQRLLENVDLNRLTNVSCYRLALSDSAMQLDMTTSLDGYDAWNSLARPIAGNAFAVELVDCTTWNSFAREHDLVAGATMIKIDVEGWESRALSGGSEVLSRPDAPVLQVEFTEQAAQSASSSCAELYNLLAELGYQMFVYDAMSRSLIPEPLRENYRYLNLIAAKRPEQVLARLGNRSRRQGPQPRDLSQLAVE